MSLKKSSALTGCFIGDEAGLLGTGAGAGASFFFDLLNKNIFFTAFLNDFGAFTSL
jgi:hypothetical protein